MKQLIITAAAGILLSLTTGCTIVGLTDYEDDTGYYEEDYYIDSYVHIPYDVRHLIADHVDGYSLPPVSRYGYELYPRESRDPENIPSYISADFNGDGYSDYAYMFSRIRWAEGSWHLKTKLIIVTSTSFGYALSTELALGEVVGSAEDPVEEYWGIRLLCPGTHSVTWYDGSRSIEQRITLEDDGIYLASIDPQERSVIYVENDDVVEVRMDMGAVAKKRENTDNRSERIITLAGKHAGTAGQKQ